MIPKDDYECPRCGYSSHRKSNMYNHLYKKLKPCHGSREVIELTEPIKQHILENKVYKVPAQTQQQITINQINNNLQIINYIARIDPMKRLQVYIDHNNITLVPFEDKVREQYIDDIEKCQDINTQLNDWSLDRHKLANIFNDITVSNGIDGINVVYDKTNDKLYIYDEDWESYPFETGVRTLIEKVQFVYLDKYEELLLDKYDHDYSPLERRRAQEHLIEYYAFLNVYQIKPYLNRGRTKTIVEYNDKYHSVFDKPIKPSLLLQMKEIKKSIYNMVRSNSITSINELNKGIMDVLCIDQEFKATIFGMLQLSI